MNGLTFTFEVTIPRVAGVTSREMADFIKTAIACWGGSLSPEHPLGPPCPLGKRGAVKVTKVQRAAVAGVLRRLIAAFDAEIRDEYEGTSMLASRLAEIDFAREMLKVVEAQS